ncbi:hypothetical protein I4U23_013329 [Adineta vaga]|nr:hypothetical protein I4U23_013329 [Adineta vaga]
MIKEESVYDNQQSLPYGERYTICEYEPVTDETIRKLNLSDNGLQRLDRSMLTCLKYIKDDAPRFLGALDSCRISVGGREMIANSLLSQHTMHYYNKSSLYTDEFRTAHQPQIIPMEQDENDRNNISSSIQSTSQIDLPSDG